MARRVSPLYDFVMDALMGDKYPFILYWIDTNEGKFCLKCICKSKKGWTPLHSKIFEDYHKLKPRKSNDKRQRFLVAMRACPFIEPLDDISTKEEKYYNFRAHGTSSVAATDEIAALSASNEVEMQENPLPEMDAENRFPFAESGPPPGDPSMDEIVDGNDLGSGWSPVLAVGNDSLPEVLDPQIYQLLERVESYVPDVAENVPGSPGIGASPSLYDDPADAMISSQSCSQALGSSSSDQWNLPPEEFSCHFRGIENIPPDYDPAKAFLESMGTPKPAETSAVPKAADPNLLGIVQTVPGSLGESAKCSSVKIVKLNDNDGIVRSLRGDNSEKKFFMMVLKTGE